MSKHLIANMDGASENKLREPPQRLEPQIICIPPTKPQLRLRDVPVSRSL